MKPATHITEFTDGSLALPVSAAAAGADALPTTAIAAAASAGAIGARASSSRLGDFFELTKPRMNFLVIVTTMVGYYMAVDPFAGARWVRLVQTILGTAMTAAAASVLNQHVERSFDGRMRRTANRPLPTGRISPIESLCLGMLLAVAGVLYLATFVNPLTALLGAFTLGSYVFVYTPLKRVTSLCTVVGAVPGAIPPMMGWTAYHGALSPEAIALFAILFMWQMPHFLAIAILYNDDYRRGGFKMLPVVDPGLHSTSRHIVLYGLSLIPVTLMPVALRMAGTTYFVSAVLLGLGFLSFGISSAVTKTRADARKLFFASIIYLPALLAMMMVDKIG